MKSALRACPPSFTCWLSISLLRWGCTPLRLRASRFVVTYVSLLISVRCSSSERSALRFGRNFDRLTLPFGRLLSHMCHVERVSPPDAPWRALGRHTLAMNSGRALGAQALRTQNVSLGTSELARPEIMLESSIVLGVAQVKSAPQPASQRGASPGKGASWLRRFGRREGNDETGVSGWVVVVRLLRGIGHQQTYLAATLLCAPPAPTESARSRRAQPARRRRSAAAAVDAPSIPLAGAPCAASQLEAQDSRRCWVIFGR